MSTRKQQNTLQLTTIKKFAVDTASVAEALRECNLAIEKDMHLLGDMLPNMCKEIEVFKDPFNRFCEESEVKDISVLE